MSGVRLNIKSNFFTLNNKTMFFYLLFFYLLSESMATGSTNDSTNYNVSNKITCHYQGNHNNDGSYTVVGKSIPGECHSILYSSMNINNSSMIDIDKELLKSVTDLNKTVIVSLIRTELYSGWSKILGVNGNANETKILCDFAKNHNIQGYDICFLDPISIDVLDRNVSRNIIPYIKQLKELCPFLVITASIRTSPEYLKNEYIYNFTELNKVLTYFNIYALELNCCNPMLYNGVTPTTKCNTCNNSLYSLEEVVSNLKETKICFNKISMTIPLGIDLIDNNDLSYSEMCKAEFDNSSMCVQTSQNYYKKGKFCSKHKFGIIVVGVEWDDFSNACNCTSTFNGFHNIYAGYTNGMLIPCSKFDVQSTVYPYK